VKGSDTSNLEERGPRGAVPGEAPRHARTADGGPHLAPSTLPPRILGEVGPSGPGPTLLVVSALHGNEPAGVEASRRVLDRLEERAGGLRGRVLFMVGNRAALRAGVRYLARDLNRAWTASRLERLASGIHDGPEDTEQRELLEELDRILSVASGPVYALDLHTTSGSEGVFTTVGDTLENRALARALPVPLVLGLEELVEGTLHDYLASRGVVTVSFESGQHEEPEAVARAEAAVWILLAATGLLPESQVPELGPSRSRLSRAGRELPRVVELRHRHPIREGDGFRMRPGFRNFEPIRRGDRVASDRRGPVTVPHSGRILMPLYQALGEDGYFVVRDFRVHWLHVSRVLRKLEAHRFVHLLPGIRRDPLRPQVLIVNRVVARWYALQLMHLLGFRRYREDGDTLVVLKQGAEHP
jgi:predicted deacylase